MSLIEEQPWTYERYLELPDDGNRYEVIEDRLYVSPSPSTIHQILSKRLQFEFYKLELDGEGFVFNAPMDLKMEGASPVQPDLMFFRRDQKGQVKKTFLMGAPFLIVEIQSPSTASRDRVIKLRNYAKNKVSHYWLLDPEAATLEMLRLDGEGYRVDTVLGAEERYEPPELPGVEIDMTKLFADLPQE